MQSYEHFTQAQRACLQIMSKSGKSLRQMAKEVGKNPSSISRELKRNANKNGEYNADFAFYRYRKRRKKCIRKSRIVGDEKLVAFIQKKLKIFWSPEAITQKWKQSHALVKLSVTTVYSALDKGLIADCSAKTHLRRRGKKRYGKRSKFNTIQPNYTVHDRPECISKRERIGDWEGDTIVGRGNKSGLVSLVDRKSRYLRLWLVKSRSSVETANAISQAMHGLPAHSLTLDNGSEFARFTQIEKNVGLRVYFADPHSPWQRGSNENINGAVRFFFPKETDFTQISMARVKQVEELINKRPRKCLNWRTPFEVFHARCCT